MQFPFDNNIIYLFNDNIFNLLFKKIKSRKTNIKFVTCSSANNIEIKNILTQ